MTHAPPNAISPAYTICGSIAMRDDIRPTIAPSTETAARRGRFLNSECRPGFLSPTLVPKACKLARHLKFAQTLDSMTTEDKMRIDALILSAIARHRINSNGEELDAT
jgi:hypothetical protein